MTPSDPQRPPRPLVVLFGLPRHLYRHGWGWVLGHRFLQLTHTGRSSGRTYQTIMEVVHYDPDSQESTVTSGFGPGADWLRNVQANDQAEISIGRSPFTATHRMAARGGDGVLRGLRTAQPSRQPGGAPRGLGSAEP
jgi:deazaflavin-dependent oxidoreductase (nitroreductase family)